jgi:hypothetical protein
MKQTDIFSGNYISLLVDILNINGGIIPLYKLVIINIAVKGNQYPDGNTLYQVI